MNSNMLLGKIKENGYSMTDFLNIMDMPPSTWSKKIRGITEFTRYEIQRMIHILSLTENDLIDIFFNEKVS